MVRRGGSRAEELDRGDLLVVGPGPALVELDEEVRVREGPSVDDGLQQVDEDHHQDADEDEGDEGPEVMQDQPYPVPQAALLPRVGRPAGGGQGSLLGLVLDVRGALGWVMAERVHREKKQKKKDDN